MDHSEAVAAGMVERYVLGELSGTERDAFEEHYFSCSACAVDLQAAFDLRDAVRSVGGAERPGPGLHQIAGLDRKSPASGMIKQWGAWAAVLAIAAGYQAFVQVPGMRTELRELQQPRLFAGAKVLRTGARAVKPEPPELRAGQPLQFFLEIPVEPQYKEYEVRVTPPGGAPVFTRIVAEQASEAVVMVIPKAQSGSYQIVISGTTSPGAVRQLEESEIVVP